MRKIFLPVVVLALALPASGQWLKRVARAVRVEARGKIGLERHRAEA